MANAPAKAKSAAKRAPGATTKAKKKAAPGEMNTLSPHLVCAGAADAIDFYKRAFGAVAMGRMPGKDGKLMHGLVTICGSYVMLVDADPNWGVLSPKTYHRTPMTL